MDTGEMVENLKAKLTCSICLNYFTDPVTTRCGHNFCLECLLRCLQEASEIPTCPVCREVIQEDDLVVNKSFQSLSITGKMVRSYLLQSTMDLSTCEQHGQKEKFFCEEDKRLFCESCLSDPEHKDHQVLPLQTAVHKYKEKLQKRKCFLQKKIQDCDIALNRLRRGKIQCEQDVNVFKYFLTSEYEKIYQFLQEEKKLHLQKLDQEFRDNMEKIEEGEFNLSRDIQSVQEMITGIDENLDKDPLEMLQDMKETLERNEELLLATPEFVCSDWTICRITGLREILLNFHKDISLDPETANPHLILSEDLKTVKYSRAPQDLPDNEERFDCCTVVLGAQTFTSGKHYWEVQVEEKTDWEVGICLNSISRKGRLSISPEEFQTLTGFHDSNEFFIWNSQDVSQQMEPIYRLGIFLDYEKGHIAFYNAIDMCLLYSPPDSVFVEPLLPYFSPFPFDESNASGSLTICPRPNQYVAVKRAK